MEALVSTVVSVTVALVAVAGVFTLANLALDRVGGRRAESLRPWLFAGPAVLFLFAMLAVPAIRTIILSFQGGRRGEEGFTLSNWSGVLGSDEIIDLDAASHIVTSRLFIIGVVLAVLAVVLAGWRRGGVSEGFDVSRPSATLTLVAAVIAVLMAVFSTLRGILVNNLWWVVVVAGLATAFGLALAVLADRSRNESLAKTLIFMPMAISLVGAAIIWKYVYDTGTARQAQGLLNLALPGEDVDFIRGTSPGGTIVPWNNVFIMAIMIWIQTGFAMVVLSAGIKAVPTELQEAARVDGATEVQVFWRITLPQITSTLLVVITTLAITVLKIFDLVKATSNGTAGTDVLANRMYEGLRNGNFTTASTFAVMILVLVLPITYLNVRRSGQEVRA